MSVPGAESRVPGALAIEDSPLGRVFVWQDAPLFYTSRDFDGYLTDTSIPIIRRFIRERFGVDAVLRSCNQIHGTGVARVTRDPGPGSRDPGPGTSGPGTSEHWIECDSCDAIWTDERGVALGIKVADCLPVTLIDSTHHVAANIHSGWRGAAKRVTEKTLDRIVGGSAFTPRTAHAYFGPTIRQCCFEVGEEVIEQFEPGVAPYVDRTRGRRPYLDLVGFTAGLLRAAGFAPAAIHDSGLCTRCDGSPFHSYRRDRAASGRNLAIMVA